jgi:GNAT superfamily N-acetyltransferase
LQVAVAEPLAFVDSELAAIGLGVVNPSLIMKRTPPIATDLPTLGRLRVERHTRPSPTWLAAWNECAELGAARDAHFSIVSKMRDRAYFVSLHDGAGAPLAVGSFVCHGSWRCFGNLATRKDARQQGFGGLVLKILAARKVAGVGYDVLQVDRHNPAVNLYRKHGFRSAYAYHYRREMSGFGEIADQGHAPQGA